MRMEENSKRRTRRSTGRKPKTDPAVFRYGIKLTSEENGNFELLFEKSGMKQRARFIKAMIFGREMKVVRIDKVAMDYYIRLTNFYHQFQAIGNNYNQTVKAVKSNFGEKRAFALLRNLEKATIDGQEYISIEELQQAAGVSSAVIDRLRQAGALGDLPESSQVSFF